MQTSNIDQSKLTSSQLLASTASESRRYVRPRVVVAAQPLHPILIANYESTTARLGARPNPTALQFLQNPKTVVDLSKDTLGSVGFIAFVQALTEQCILQITTLDLRSNALDNNAVIEMCRAFSGSNVAEINLCGNCFGKGVVQKLKDTVMSCRGMKRVVLSGVGGICQENVDYLRRKCQGVEFVW